MGNAKCCARHQGEDLDGQDIVDIERLLPSGDACTIDLTLHEALQGDWYIKATARRVGEVTGNTLIWDSSWSLPTASIFVQNKDVQTVPNSVRLDLRHNSMEATYSAELQLEAQTCLIWNDGDIWVKK